MSLKQKILAAVDLKSEIVPIPEWDVTIEVRGMSGRSRAKFIEVAYQAGLVKEGQQPDAAMGAAMLAIFPEFVIDGVYDPATGKRVFEKSDLDELQGKNGEVIERIALKVIELSGLNDQGLDKQGKPISAVDSAAKN